MPGKGRSYWLSRLSQDESICPKNYLNSYVRLLEKAVHFRNIGQVFSWEATGYFCLVWSAAGAFCPLAGVWDGLRMESTLRDICLYP